MRMFILQTAFFFGLCGTSLLSQSEIHPENLGNAINSECDELQPIISPDGKTLYFCRGECPGNIGGQDIWFSTLGADGKWTKAKNIGPPLNNDHNNFICSVSPDGTTLLLGNAYNDDGSVEKGCSISHLTKNGWGKPEKVVIKDYYNVNNNANFFLASDGHTLLMTIEREDSYGKRDIYVSFLNKDGTWTKPVNAGRDINTAGDEISPFLASDDVTLYFSSDGRGGYGDADVFVTRRLDETWQKWSVPENLGPTINTNRWDAYYKVSAIGDYAYFVSEVNSFGKSDIFRIRLPESVRPNPVVLVSGKIVNYKTQAPIESQIIYSVLPDGKHIAKANSNPISGDYQILLPGGSNYEYLAFAKDFISENWQLDITKIKSFEEIHQDLELIPASDSIFCIKNVFFQKNMYEINIEGKNQADKGIEFLQNNTDCIVEIAGHTDSTGTKDINLRVAQNRAENVAQYFISKGIGKDRIIMLSVGFDKPNMPNNSETGRQLNRRVEFKVMRKNK